MPQTTPASSAVQVALMGCFRVSAANGGDLTPTGAKSKALLALLAVAPGGKRSRTWVQDKLWSDRARTQGSASLRQCLVEIRKCLGIDADVLLANRLELALDLSRVEIDLHGHGEFLEGLDVRDEAFEDWLRQERAVLANRHAAPALWTGPTKEPVVFFARSAEPGTFLSVLEQRVADGVAQTLRECSTIRSSFGEPSDDHSLTLRVGAERIGDKAVSIRVALETGRDRILDWSDHALIQLAGAIPTEDHCLLKLTNRAAETIISSLCRKVKDRDDRGVAIQLCRNGVADLFTMDPNRFSVAEASFLKAHDACPRGLFLAWRAMLRALGHVERHGGDAATRRDEGLALIARALEDEADNSTVLSLASICYRILKRDFYCADELAVRSLEANPGNPLAWYARSNSKLYLGDVDLADAMALRGRHLVAHAPHRHWWDLQCALTAACRGDTVAAIDMAERSAAMAPSFRPPLRYLTALHAMRGDIGAAEGKALALNKLERDFTPERLWRDADYPTSLLRTYGLLNTDKLRELPSVLNIENRGIPVS
ncbi:MAG: hypothetical protein AAF713_22470 [Pseudomonadota bacterium]